MADIDKQVILDGTNRVTQRWKEIVSGVYGLFTAVAIYFGDTEVSAADPLPVTGGGGVALPVSVADGADVAEGATTDAVVAAGAAGSVSAKLRRLTSDVDAVKTAVETIDNAISGTEMQVDVVAALPAGTNNIGDVDIASALPAGANLMGKVGIDQTTPGTTNKVVSDVPTVTPTAYNVTLTVADTEYSQALPANCRGFEFQARTEATVRYAFVTGKVATPTAPWLTLKAGDYYFSPPLNQAASPSTLYVGSATAGTIVEILAWT